ncbi:hypothetical protein INT47_000768 [Mucor saturninus]|uniref:RFX-type winged-helix domain-containing protein n=1 Tax=Mucor saturninus TaxID=64648 RepID=A0A8H7QLR8_9FUNG|nr:hypothetical protein INT47_000768 [Mucor saturninus]
MSLSSFNQQQAMATNKLTEIPDDSTALDNSNDSRREQLRLIQPTMSTPESNNLELLDPSIMADRETSMHVTAWVGANYIQEREHNVPRRNMFEHYKAFCTANNLTPVNSATFGKLLRVVFPELKTRRLGVRGQSKYHYCGIRVRTPDDMDIVGRTNYPSDQNTMPPATLNSPSTIASGSSSSAQPSPSTGSRLPGFTAPSPALVGTNQATDNNLITSFTNAYERHCTEILDLLATNQVDKIKEVMKTFYGDMPDRYVRLIQSTPEVTEAVWRWDCSLYDSMILNFLPSIHYTLSPERLNSLRTYTRELREYIESNLVPYPANFYQKKADVARIFAAKFRRQLSLNFAAHTASSVLNMPEHIVLMRYDWEHFDFDGILDQALWVCECDTSEVRNILRHEVSELLNSKGGIEQWMGWVAMLVDKYLKRYTPTSLNDANHYLARCKQLLLKWSFHTTLVMKDLTLQQARSFGSFHSLKLFLDDYILYMVEENIAQVNYALMQQQQQREDASSSYYVNSNVATPSERNTN